jgi:Flp pilus assembly protein TadG
MVSTTAFAREEEGSEIVEFGLVILPLFGFLFLIMSVCWVIFAQASLQYAVTAGVRFAITGQNNGNQHQDAAVQAVVEQSSMGFLTDTSHIQIQYYNPATLQPVSGVGSNSPGNLIQITVSNLQVNPLAPILGGSNSASSITASAADVVEGTPGSTPPPR